MKITTKHTPFYTRSETRLGFKFYAFQSKDMANTRNQHIELFLSHIMYKICP